MRYYLRKHGVKGPDLTPPFAEYGSCLIRQIQHGIEGQEETKATISSYNHGHGYLVGVRLLYSNLIIDQVVRGDVTRIGV